MRLNTFEVQELFIVFVDFVYIIIVSVWSLALFVIEVDNSITLPQLLMLQVSLSETLKVSCLSNFETAFVWQMKCLVRKFSLLALVYYEPVQATN